MRRSDEQHLAAVGGALDAEHALILLLRRRWHEWQEVDYALGSCHTVAMATRRTTPTPAA